MCQQGGAEIRSNLLAEKEDLHQKYEEYERGERELTDFELQTMAVRMIMIRDAL